MLENKQTLLTINVMIIINEWKKQGTPFCFGSIQRANSHHTSSIRLDN